MPNPYLLFLDTETLGLDDEAPTWEIAWLLVHPHGGVFERFQAFIELPDGADVWLDNLPKQFREDFLGRYQPDNAISQHDLIDKLQLLCSGDRRPIVCGSNPSFDMERLERLAAEKNLRNPGWHYHPMDVPTLAHGWLMGKGVYPAGPWKSDFISQAVGIDPKGFDRHSAWGDVAWTYALWQKVSRP